MSRLLLCSFLLVFGLGGAVPAAEPGDEGMVPLFDGKSFAGWKKVGGGASYAIDGDAIVGKVGPGSNSFLRTEKTYGDFVLKVDLKLDVPTNSGIQFRSHQVPSADGEGRVYGYQSEVDPLPRAWSGGLYEEGRRTWLYPLEGHPEAQKAFKLADWNRFTIMARGPHLRTWVNGIPCADIIDGMDLEGFIALQVHAGKAGQIRFKNIRLRDLGQSTRVPLWDGKTLTGWSTKGGGQWRIDEGAIHATQPGSQAERSQLVCARPYADFALRLRYKVAKGNLGLILSYADGSLLLPTLFLPDPFNPPAAKKGEPKAVKPQEGWNQLDTIALGGTVVVQVNGLTIRTIPNDRGGKPIRIALVLAGGQETVASVKEIAILPLDDDRYRTDAR